jgi:hypothetical protein
MKKITMLFMMVLLAAGIFAQDAQTRNNRQRPEAAPPKPPETVTLSGSLVLVNGRIALQSGSDVYYVTGIQQLIGFVDGLKEGAQVSLEGYSRSFNKTETTKLLLATKLTIGGKSYDLAPEGRIGNGPQANGPRPDVNRGPTAGPRGNQGMPCWGAGGPGPRRQGQGSRNNNRP